MINVELLSEMTIKGADQIKNVPASAAQALALIAIAEQLKRIADFLQKGTIQIGRTN